MIDPLGRGGRGRIGGPGCAQHLHWERGLRSFGRGGKSPLAAFLTSGAGGAALAAGLVLKARRAWLLQVQALFADCGEINAITIPVDKYTGRAKGFAYLEFADKVGTVSPS